MKHFIASYLIFSLSIVKIYSQGIDAATDSSIVETPGKLTIGGYVDAYYGFDFGRPNGNDKAYFVSSARHHEVNINLAYIDIKYTSDKIRARFAPGFGTYINANYINEPGVLKNLVEASAGLRIHKDIWLDAGVFGSPYTNESAISKDHLMYTRSFAPEYVPYYLAGAKLTLPMGNKVTAYLYFLNGWQVIKDNNDKKSFGSQLEIRPNDKLLINWNTYIGSEQSDAAPDFRTRYFTDLYVIFNPSERFSATACVYYGVQQREDDLGESSSSEWFNANMIGKYNFTDKFGISGRLEYFYDPESVQITPVTDVAGFSSYSASLCLNYQVAPNALLRLESRSFFSDKNVYLNDAEEPSAYNQWAVANISIWF
ncbi:MAG: porin [Microscillaceae bacterium]|nr:porin [Microscillaceae bacterium]